MTLSKKKQRKQSKSQVVLSLLSLLIVGSMVISFVVVGLQPSTPIPTPSPTITPPPRPTSSPAPPATDVPPAEPTGASPEATATSEPTEPVVGPVLPTASPTVSPTLTITPAGAGINFSFAVCGDSRDNPDIYQRVLDAVQTDGSEFLVHTGDLVNRGTDSQWEGFREQMAGFALPFYPVPGNHDGLNGELDGYLAYSGAPTARYSFDREPIHFAMADSHNGGIGASELAWLQTDLSGTRQPVKMVFLHHPPFDPDGGDHIMAYGNEPFMELMAATDVDYVFAGHIHAFAQEERDGVVYTITGGAGAPLYGEEHPQAFHHYLRVTLQGGDVAIEVVEI
jgi:predicted phosphodiesterase